MSNRRTVSPVELVKSLCIFVLLVLMLVLLILLLLGQRAAREEALPEADRMVVYASGVQPMDTVGMETFRVMPYLIAYRQEGGALSVLHASAAEEKPYEVLYPLIRGQIGPDTVCHALDASAREAVLSACAAADTLIYLCYNGVLPSSVICAYTYSDEDSIGADGMTDNGTQMNNAYIKELFFVPASAMKPVSDLLPFAIAEEDSRICALSRDDRGDVMLFAAADSAVMSAALPDDGALDSYTASLDALSGEAQTGTFGEHITSHPSVRLDGLYRMPEITCMPFAPSASLYDTPQTLAALLRLLGMNESDTDNYYTAGTGDRVYLNANGRLTLSDTEASVRYDALQEGGLALADYLGYSSIGGDYRLSEYLRAADRLLTELEMLLPAFGGDGLRCTLVDAAVTERDVLCLTYAYTYRAVPLTDADGKLLEAMVLRAGDGVISQLELYPCHAAISETEQYLLPQSVTLDALCAEYPDSTPPDCLFMLYRSVRQEQGAPVYTADWIGLAE